MGKQKRLPSAEERSRYTKLFGTPKNPPSLSDQKIIMERLRRRADRARKRQQEGKPLKNRAARKPKLAKGIFT